MTFNVIIIENFRFSTDIQTHEKVYMYFIVMLNCCAEYNPNKIIIRRAVRFSKYKCKNSRSTLLLDLPFI